jgi:hypothetical protein
MQEQNAVRTSPAQHAKLQVVVNNQQNTGNVSAFRMGHQHFVRQQDRQRMFDNWRSRRISLMGLVRSHKPLKLLNVEAVMIDEIARGFESRDRQISQLQRLVEIQAEIIRGVRPPANAMRLAA